MNALRAVAVALVFATSAFAQQWNSTSGGWNTGYGTVYGSFGLAQATQGLYNTMQLNLQRATARQAMVNQFGEAAVAKAEREAKAGKPLPEAGPQVAAPPPVSRGAGRFKPGRSPGTAKELADALGSTPEEKAALVALVDGTKQAFEAEPDTKAWRNNVAGALAFFIIGNTTIALDAPEPSPAQSQALFQALELALDDVPELAKAPAKDKQQLYEALIGFTGLPLALYTQGKESGDAESVKQARELSTQLLKLVLRVEPSQLRLAGQ